RQDPPRPEPLPHPGGPARRAVPPQPRRARRGAGRRYARPPPAGSRRGRRRPRLPPRPAARFGAAGARGPPPRASSPARGEGGGAMKRVALVTGAGRGVGFEICRQLGALGYTVVLTARDPERGATAARDLGREGLDVRFRELDVTEPAAVREVAAGVASELGR